MNCYTVGGRRGGRGGYGGHDPLVNRRVKIRIGPFKGYHGIVKEVKTTFVRVELESQMKIVTGKSYFLPIKCIFKFLLKLSDMLSSPSMQLPAMMYLIFLVKHHFGMDNFILILLLSAL